MTDITVTPEIYARIQRKGYVQGWVPFVELQHKGGEVVPVGKLRPWWDDPILRERETGKLVWNPNYQPAVKQGGDLAESHFAARGYVSRPIEVDKTPSVRTSARHKYRWLYDLLTKEARGFLQPDGKVHWPASVQRELDEAAWKQGKPGALSMEEQVELLARTYIVTTANRQKAQDQKKVTTDWHGHSAA